MFKERVSNIEKLAIGFLVATSSLVMADTVVTGVINTENKVSDSQLPHKNEC